MLGVWGVCVGRVWGVCGVCEGWAFVGCVRGGRLWSGRLWSGVVVCG